MLLVLNELYMLWLHVRFAQLAGYQCMLRDEKVLTYQVIHGHWDVGTCFKILHLRVWWGLNEHGYDSKRKF